jgi:CRP/FNR family cyclic AMP-dependent transcriptional regulator
VSDEILALSADLPVIDVAPGEVVISEGGQAGSIWILVSGSLRVLKGDVEVNTVTHPGAVIGEMAVLLGAAATATVQAAERSSLRLAADGAAWLASDARVTRLVATGLAGRLAFVTSYLSDLKHQYGDAPGLAMVSDVLRELEQRQVPRAVPGSARDPDPRY